jgi:hypothetical protein
MEPVPLVTLAEADSNPEPGLATQGEVKLLVID